CDRFRREAEFGQHLRLDVGAVDAVAADRARELPERNLACGLLEPCLRPRELGEPAGELEAESNRLGMDPVAAPDHHCLAMSVDLLADGSLEALQRFQKNFRGFDELE